MGFFLFATLTFAIGFGALSRVRFWGAGIQLILAALSGAFFLFALAALLLRALFWAFE